MRLIELQDQYSASGAMTMDMGSDLVAVNFGNYKKVLSQASAPTHGLLAAGENEE